MSDRPSYGEFASPEEQRARSGQGHPEQIDPALIAQDSPDSFVPRAGKPRLQPGQLVDRIVTIVLLGYGLFNALSSISAFTVPQEVLRMVGISATLSDPAAMRNAGFFSVLVLIGGWVLTTWLCWKRGAARKTTWWLAVLGGVVFTFAAALIVSIALVQDPAVMQTILDTAVVETPAP